jgi:hypothetical protein
MTECTQYEPLIELMLAEEIEPGQLDRLLSHAEDCAGCRQFVDLHYQLQEPALTPELPSEAGFSAMRRTVLRQISEDRKTGTPGLASLSRFFKLLSVPPVRYAAAAALLLVVLFTGVYTGRNTLPLSPAAQPSMLADLRSEAVKNAQLSDVENSDYLYSNVDFREVDENVVAVSFDVTRHIEVARNNDDPMVQEILAQSLMNPAPISSRLNALNQAGKVQDRKVQQALIFAMRNDPDTAVRLRAQSVLISYPSDTELQTAMMAVLGDEESVQMRMRALDYLAVSDLSPARFDTVLDDLRVVDDMPLMIHAASLERRPAGMDP